MEKYIIVSISFIVKFSWGRLLLAEFPIIYVHRPDYIFRIYSIYLLFTAELRGNFCILQN